MNKFEKLIEYVINDEDSKAQSLFHSIVVEKSRNIYEGLMNDDEMGGNQVDELINDVEADERGFGGMNEAGEEEEIGMDDGMGMDDEMPAMDDEMGMDDEMPAMEEGFSNELDENVSLTKVTKGISNSSEAEGTNKKTINNDNAGKKLTGGSASPVNFTSTEEKGAGKVSYKDEGSTTEPKLSNVSKPKAKGEEGGVNKKSLVK